MKILTILVTVLLAFAMMVPLVAAEDVVEDLEVVEPGVAPDSPLYGLDRAMERLRLAVTAGKAAKAKLKLKYAEERLAEAEQMIDEDKVEEADEAQEAHDEELEEVEELVEELETDGEEEVAEEALEEVEEIQLSLLAHGEKVAFVKDRILNRMRQRVNVSEEQLAHLEEVFAKIKAKALEQQQKMNEKREQLRTRYKVLANLTEEDLTEKEAAFLQRKERIRDKIKGLDDEDEELEEEEEEPEEEP